MLNGQKLQGPITAEEVNHMLANKNMENKLVWNKNPKKSRKLCYTSTFTMSFFSETQNGQFIVFESNMQKLMTNYIR